MFLRLCLLGVALASSFVGNLSLKSSEPQDLAIGGGAILIAILCFFFLAKGLWRFLGCLTTFIIVAVIVGGLCFFLSGSDVISTVSESFLSKKSSKVQSAPQKTQPPQLPQGMIQGEASQASAFQAQGQVAQAQAVAPVLLEEGEGAPAQPAEPPTLEGNVESILAGDVMSIKGNKVRLYGVATPLMDQNCTDASGTSFQCGYTAARMIKDFISGDTVTCRIMNINAQKELLGACNVGGMDIGAAMVEAGWAIALPGVTAIYMPYQMKAEENQSGLWAGTFQMPWIWAAQREEMRKSAKKVNVKDYMPKVKKKSIFNAL